MSLGFDIWGAIAGAIGTLSLFPMIYNLIKSQLPSERFKTLQETMVETVSLFRSVNEEGLLKDVDYVVETEIKLALLHGEVEDLRRATHCATTFVQEFMEMLRGLSRRIYILCEEIRSIQANISNTSSEERKRLLSEGHVPRPDSTRSISGWSICTLSRVPLLTTTTAAGMPSAMADTFQSYLQPIAQDSSEITCDHPTTPTCWPAPSVCPPEATSSQIPQSEHGRGCFTDARNPSNDTTHNTSDGLPRMLSSKSDICRDSTGKGDPITPTTRTSDAQHTVLHDNPECGILRDRYSDRHNLDSALHSATDVPATFACQHGELLMLPPL
ncbi:hypothetical protein A0H81_10168 [Grifola frondosa]|uniref:Uncharacterized protein n=1 Tax=Grifola frondosa TaxID=5627 RepID=A0A1C7LYH4_GRIFR|nr:hypothetical protein A0H81_10168 [Grifola frondosa]